MLTQAQWFARLASWYPQWWLTPGGVFEAHLKALAKVLETAGADLDGELAKTFVDQAEADVLDTHAAERSVTRRDGESDAQLRLRVKNFALSVTQDDLVTAVNGLLPMGSEALFLDRMTWGPWYDVENLFFDQGDELFILDQRRLYNYFYVYIPQLPPTNVLSSNVTIAEGTTEDYAYLHVPAGFTLTVNGTMNVAKLLLEGTIVYGPNSSVNIGAADDFYATLTEQILVVKAFGVDFEILSEAFA